MKFTSYQIKGRGRARKMGFPTINLSLPKSIDLKEGVYAAYLIYKGKKYIGAMHYGPSPAFKDKQISLEIFLIDLKEKLPDLKEEEIKVETVKYLRPVLNFDTKERLINQIENDVKEINVLTD